MIDFHTHILPDMDDGASDIEMSLNMLRMSKRQGIATVCATPHFYAYEDSMSGFIRRRRKSYERLQAAMQESGETFPQIRLGAEVYYFEGMSEASELEELVIENSRCLLIEPPMDKWSKSIIDDIEQTGLKLNVIPVIAHLDRYIAIFNAPELADKIRKRRIIYQINASFFYRENSELAMELLRQGKINLIGSDCHNTDMRRPNIIFAKKAINDAGLGGELVKMEKRAQNIFNVE